MLRTHFIDSAAELRAASSPVRIRILGQLGTQARTARELAALLGVSVHGVHYHLRELSRIGLLASEPGAGTGGKSGRRFRTVAPRIRVSPEVLEQIPSRSRSRDAGRLVRAVLEGTARDVDAAAREGALGESLPAGLHAYNRVRIPRRRVAEFQRKLRALVEDFEAAGNAPVKPRPTDALATFGVVFLPVPVSAVAAASAGGEG